MKYYIKAKVFKTATGEFKQRMTAKAGKLKRFKVRVAQYKHNCFAAIRKFYMKNLVVKQEN